MGNHIFFFGNESLLVGFTHRSINVSYCRSTPSTPWTQRRVSPAAVLNNQKILEERVKKVWSKLDAFWKRCFDLSAFFWGSLGTSWEGVLPLVGLLGTLWGHPGAASRPILASNKSPKWAFERKWSELGSSLHRLKASGPHFGGFRDSFCFLQELFLSLQTRILEPPMVKLMISCADCKNAYRLSAIKARRNAQSD